MERNIVFDYLKFIALLGIILAHVNPPGVIFQLRNFDVPLMILISIWLSIRTLEKESFSYKDYIIKRIKRLVFPTWIFLTIYFIIKILIKNEFLFMEILRSYLLIDGIGYVWVIRIYLYIAILTPIIKKIIDKWSMKKIIFLTIIVYLIYEFIYFLTRNNDGLKHILMEVFIWDIVGYSFVIVIGLLTYKMSNSQLLKTSFSFGGLFLVLMIIFNFTSTQSFKYPVRIYYLSYAFFISLLLLIVFKNLYEKRILARLRLISFISDNSMWIYLWHIIILPIVSYLFLENKYGFIIRFLMVFVLAILITIAQNQIMKFMKKFNCLLKNSNVKVSQYS